MQPLIAVVTTVATREQAQALADALVELRLAACAQVSAIDSVYRWQGVLQHEGEFRVVFKTTAARYAAIEAAIRERHAYALPQICAVALDPVDASYAAWVEAQCGTAPPG